MGFENNNGIESNTNALSTSIPPSLTIFINLDSNYLGAYLHDKAYLNGLFSDVVLSVSINDNLIKSFKLHKLILAQSTYFLNLILSDNEINNQNDEILIKLELFEGLLTVDTITKVILFLYTNNLPFLINNRQENSDHSDTQETISNIDIKTMTDFLIALTILEYNDTSNGLLEQIYQVITKYYENNLNMDRIEEFLVKTYKLDAYFKYKDNKMKTMADKIYKYGLSMIFNKANNVLLNNSNNKNNTNNDTSDNVKKLEQILESLPFDMFKYILESDKLKVQNTHRFKMAKLLINKRNTNNHNKTGKESVSMSFGSTSSIKNSKGRINIVSTFSNN